MSPQETNRELQDMLKRAEEMKKRTQDKLDRKEDNDTPNNKVRPGTFIGGGNRGRGNEGQ